MNAVGFRGKVHQANYVNDFGEELTGLRKSFYFNEVGGTRPCVGGGSSQKQRGRGTEFCVGIRYIQNLKKSSIVICIWDVMLIEIMEKVTLLLNNQKNAEKGFPNDNFSREF